jgi:hypothetical protein
MRVLTLILLFFFVGCATKYIVPTNRFFTPESQGGIFSGQVEYQNTQAHQLAVLVDGGNVDQGVIYSTVARGGYSFSTSFTESLDLVWSHLAGGNSLGGIKVQFLGSSRSSKGAGHKLSGLALLGSNEYETSDKSIVFTLSAQEFVLLYGYRISEIVFPYVSLNRANYNFQGTISSSDPDLNGKQPSYETMAIGINGGVELDWNSFFLKTEASYQMIETNETPNMNSFNYGFSFGAYW